MTYSKRPTFHVMTYHTDPKSVLVNREVVYDSLADARKLAMSEFEKHSGMTHNRVNQTKSYTLLHHGDSPYRTYIYSNEDS